MQSSVERTSSSVDKTDLRIPKKWNTFISNFPYFIEIQNTQIVENMIQNRGGVRVARIIVGVVEIGEIHVDTL